MKGNNMGMFSWLCKGCGHELKTNELVRMNACVGEYSGYGSAGGFEYSGSYNEPSCWHVLCYNKASVEEKLSDSSSEYAPNQGFGIEALEFLRGFDPNIAVENYIPHFDTYKDEERQFLYITPDGLLDEIVWEKIHEEVGEKYWSENEFPKDYDLWDDQQKSDYSNQILKSRIEIAGGDLPSRRAIKYNSLQEALDAAAQFESPSMGDYSLIVLADQNKLHGLVYEKNVSEVREGEYPNRIKTGRFESEITYTIGVKHAQ
jgi:hypothetical protein